jgi:hypothetical protein
MIRKKLDTGDYTMEGLEHKLCVERKASIEEMASNLGADNKERFERELQRMTKYEHKYLVLEFPLQDLLDYPNNSSLPEEIKKKLKLSGKYILKKLIEFQLNYGVHIVFCEDKVAAFFFVASLFKRCSEKYL